MKMFKRLLAMVIAFSMIAVLPAFAETTEETVDNTRYSELVSKLEAIGVWQLDKKADDTINRAEFASLMANLVAADNSGVADTAFVDVDKNSEYYNAIAYMKSYGIMNGIDAERFSPLRTITYNEALKTVLCLLGYGDRAEVKGGYPNGYVNIGLSLGFKVGTGELTAYEAAKMLEQAAFKVRLMTVIGYKTNELVTILGTEGDTTVLNQYHNIYRAKGTVTDNGFSQIYTDSSINQDDMMVKIDGEAFIFDGDRSIRKALNSKIEYYYKDDKGIKTLLWWEYANNTREELVVYAENLLNENGDFTRTNLVYEVNGKKKTATISPSAAFIYNEVDSSASFTVEDLKLTEGWLTLIDDNGDNVYDIVFADVYENYFVNGISNNGEIFSDRFNRSLDTSKFETVEVYSPEGNDITVDPSAKIDQVKLVYYSDRSAGSPADAVAVNNVISVFKSKTDGNGEGRYLKIILSQAAVTDTLNAIEKDEEATVYTVGANEYKVNNFLISKIGVDHSLAEIKQGERYRFYLDYRGEIAYFDAMSQINQYAYLLAAGKESTGMSKQAEIKAVLETGEIAILPLADEVYLDGVKTGELDVVENANIQAANQLIRMKMNSKGEVKEIETSTSVCRTSLFNAVGYDPTDFNMVFANANAYYYNNNRKMFGGTYGVGPDTKLFYIPSNGREEDIRVIKGSDAENKIKGNFDIKAYDADNVLTAKAYVYTDIPDTATVDNGKYESFFFIVLDVKGTTNSDGENVKQIRAWNFDYESNFVENHEGILPDDIKDGDIFRFQLNDEERIVKADKILETKGSNRPAPFAYNKTDKTKSTFSSTSAAILYGYPVGVNTIGVSVATGATPGTRVSFVPFYTPGIVYFDVENMDCSTAGRTAIPAFATLNEAENRFDINNDDVMVLMSTESSGMYDCIIIHY